MKQDTLQKQAEEVTGSDHLQLSPEDRFVVPKDISYSNIVPLIESGVLDPNANKEKVKGRRHRKRVKKIEYHNTWSLLIAAAAHKDFELVKYLLDKGASVEYKTCTGSTVFSAACGSLDILLYLLIRSDLSTQVSLDDLKRLPALLKPHYAHIRVRLSASGACKYIDKLYGLLDVFAQIAEHAPVLVAGKTYRDLLFRYNVLRDITAVEGEVLVHFNKPVNSGSIIANRSHSAPAMRNTNSNVSAVSKMPDL